MINKNNVVKEFIIEDGIGAQLWRKVYAMSYAKYYNLYFYNTPIKDFLIHESDKILSHDEKHKTINLFESLIDNPWINESMPTNWELCPYVGAGLPDSQGVIPPPVEFTKIAPSFNLIKEKENNVVLHIRRGNVIPENPRWISDEVYINILKQLPEILNTLKIKPEKIIILTDGPNYNKSYTPIDSSQDHKWNQKYLIKQKDGSYPITSINYNALLETYPNITILNNLEVYEAFLIMLKAQLLIVSRSAFSQVAGLLSNNKVIEMFNSYNCFKNTIGSVSQNGTISLLQNMIE